MKQNKRKQTFESAQRRLEIIRLRNHEVTATWLDSKTELSWTDDLNWR